MGDPADVTSSSASENAPFGAALAAASLRRRGEGEAHAAALGQARLLRAAQRQWPAFVIGALAITALGTALDVLGGAPWRDALSLWAALGAGAALTVALLRELGRNTITSLASLGKHRGYTILGAAPELTPGALRQLPPDARTPMGSVILQPASPFSAAFRQLQSTIAADGLVAFIGSRADDGASTAALCAAISAQQQGRRVIVLDCDVRRRSLTRALEHEPREGVMEAAEAPERWRDFIAHEGETGLAILPAAPLRNPWRTLFAAPGLQTLLTALRSDYDLVILDCPPALGNAEGAMLARLAHKCVVVAAWDETPLSAVRASIRTLRARSRATTGLYINRVPAGYRFGRLRPE